MCVTVLPTRIHIIVWISINFLHYSLLYTVLWAYFHTNNSMGNSEARDARIMNQRSKYEITRGLPYYFKVAHLQPPRSIVQRDEMCTQKCSQGALLPFCKNCPWEFTFVWGCRKCYLKFGMTLFTLPLSYCQGRGRTCHLKFGMLLLVLPHCHFGKDFKNYQLKFDTTILTPCPSHF